MPEKILLTPDLKHHPAHPTGWMERKVIEATIMYNL